MNLGERLDLVRRPDAEVAPARLVPMPANGHAGNGSQRAEIKASIHRTLIETLGPRLNDPEVSARDLETRVRSAVHTALEGDPTPMSVPDRARLAQEIVDEVIGHGPIEPLLRDPSITEIMVNGHDQVFIERGGRIESSDVRFVDAEHVRATIDRIVARVGRRIDEASPMVDARLPDGSRVNAVIYPIVLEGPVLTVRKFAAEPYHANDLIAMGTLTPAAAHLLHLCVSGRLNALVSGGTGSGKTTTLNVLSSFIPRSERIITIEDAAELRLMQPHVVRMESRPSNTEGRGEVTIRDLVRNALRMRPDRIVVGEVRDGAALDMLQAMNTGHEGSITTVHANSPRDAMARLETMVLMAGVDLPMRAIREQVASALDLVVHQARLRDGSRRIVSISEVVGMEGEIITIQDLFTFDFGAGQDEQGNFRGALRPTGIRPRFAQRLADGGVNLPPELFLDSQESGSGGSRAGRHG